MNATERSIASLRAGAAKMKDHPDLAQRLTAEFCAEILPPYLRMMNEAARRLSANPRPENFHAMTVASCMICCNIVQNVVGMLSPSLDVGRDAAFDAVMKALLPMLGEVHRAQMSTLDDIERSVFRNGQEIEFDFRTQLKTTGDEHAQK